jgi:signal transduction histidine kinase/CheY-like chemotaxis protein
MQAEFIICLWFGYINPLDDKVNSMIQDSNMLRNFSLFFSGLILVHSILFLRLGAPGLFLFCGLIFLLILINVLYIQKYSEIAACHILNAGYLFYVAGLCRQTGGFYSILIFMLFFMPLLSSVFSGKKEKTGYIGLTLAVLFIFSFGQGFPFITVMPEEIVNLSYFRFVHFFALFLFFSASILIFIAEKERIQRGLIQSREERHQVEENAKKAMKIKDEFLANISHEIRNPMNGIIGMMHVLLDSDLNEEQKKYSQIVYNSARALLTIVNDILDLSKIQAGKLELDIRDFDLEIAIKDIIALPELQARQKGIDFLYSIDPNVPCLLQGDIGRIRQVINNLTGNAVKFTDQGHVSLAITLESDDPFFATLHFRVEDTGIGIKEDKISSLFESFTQADMSITKKYGGTGLGLAISKLFIEKMNGRVGIESIEMVGSTFWFTLPLKKQEEKKEHFSFPIQSREGIRVLAVTDGTDLGKTLKNHLNELKMDYQQALNETQAMEMLTRSFEENQPFPLVIVEVKESNILAENLGRKIKQDQGLKQTRLILLTSIGNQGDARRFEEIGFSAFLGKPIEKELFQDCIKAVLSRPSDGNALLLPIITRYSIIETKKHVRRILIVEDMETNRLTAKALIERQGYKTDEAKNGLEALEKYQKNHYDLILMDCRMPGMDGFEATQKIREHEKNHNLKSVPIIAMTGNAFDSDRQKCFEAGMDDFIPKPVEPDLLARKIGLNLTDTKDDKSGYPEGLDDFKRLYKAADEQKRPGEGDLNLEPALCFNREKLRERFGGDEETVKDILDSFFQEAPEFLDKIKEAIHNQDMEDIESLSHALKGTAANVNAEALRKAALELEIQAKKDNPEIFIEQYKIIMNEYQRFMREAKL